jgi:ubiquinone/menaquinone biosynthesis C-methylase UbiE
MTSLVSIILTILLGIVAILIAWFLFVEIVVRLIRRFIHFPIPALVARLIDNPVRRRIQPPAKVVDWIGIQEGMCVLEVGPGPGTFTIEAAKRVGDRGRVFAIDIQPAVVSQLDGRLQREGITNVTTKVASAYDLPFPDRFFDRAYMIAVLAEIPDKKKALLEIRRVLKDDGLLAVGEFLPDPDYPRRKTVIHWCKDADLELADEYGGILHYVLTFGKLTAGNHLRQHNVA